jgi:uncharacterized protein
MKARWFKSLVLVTASVVLAMLVCMLAGAGIAALAVWSVPPPTSPQLVDSQGLVLDEQAQAALVEIVFDAARGDDVETIQAFLGQGFSPNVRSTRGDALLIVAAYHDSLQVVQSLLAHPELDIEARNRMGLTAVAAAAFKGHGRPLQALLEAGADVNASNGMQQTALMFAALSGRANTTQMLITAGAARHQTDSLGNTARSLAETQGATEVLPLLQ